MELQKFYEIAQQNAMSNLGIVTSLDHRAAALLEILRYHGINVKRLLVMNESMDLEDIADEYLIPGGLNIITARPGTPEYNISSDQKVNEEIEAATGLTFYYSEDKNFVYFSNLINVHTMDSIVFALAAASLKKEVLDKLNRTAKILFRDILIDHKEVEYDALIKTWLSQGNKEKYYQEKEIEIFIEKLQKGKQKHLEQIISTRTREIRNYEHNILKKTEEVKRLQYMLVGLVEEEENLDHEMLAKLLVKNKDIIKYSTEPPEHTSLRLTIQTTLDNYNIDEAEHFLKRNYDSDKTIQMMKEMYLYNTRSFPETLIEITINLETGEVTGRTPRFSSEVFVPNLHITKYYCWDGYKSQIRKAIREGDLVIAIQTLIAGVKNINFADGTVMSDIALYIGGNYEALDKKYPLKNQEAKEDNS
jgi:hypothetical protein